MLEADTSALPDDLEADLEIEELAYKRARARGFCIAARRALALARRYRAEEGPRGRREIACVEQALRWRAAARELRSTSSALSTAGPGLARASQRLDERKRVG